MNIIIKDNYKEISNLVANKIVELYQLKNDFVLSLTTGETPKGLYDCLIEKHNENKINFSESKAFILDEYVGITKDHQISHFNYLHNFLFKNINIKQENIFYLNGVAKDLQLECENYEKKIDSNGIDIQILGVDENGTVSFNSPSSKSELYTHIEDLTQEKIQKNEKYFENKSDIPTMALSMGIGSIFKSKELILIASGESKSKIIHTLQDNIITPLIPVSILKLHPNLTVIIDKEAAKLLD